MDTNKAHDQINSADPQVEALRSMISSLLEEKLQPVKAQLGNLAAQLSLIEEDSKARYVDLRAHLTKVQASLDILNNKFDAQSDEVKFLRKSVRMLEDKADPITA